MDKGAPGVLYIVATPIGNAEDLSSRARRILSEVTLVACEDTRRTGRLLADCAIRTPTLSCFEHNEERRVPALIDRLRRGESIALVSDAGTPAIADPGYRLVRAALLEGIRVAAVPGPSAIIAALSIAGLPTDHFTFEGFLPARSAARRQALQALAAEPRTMVFYETSRRLSETLADAAAVFDGSRAAAVARELTKTFEETVRGTLDELGAHFRNTEPRGEITLIIGGAGESGRSSDSGRDVTLEMLTEVGLSLKQASAVIARLTGARRRDIYQSAIAARERKRSGSS